VSRADNELLTRIRDIVRPLIMDARLPEDMQAAAAKVSGTTDLLAAMKALADLVVVADDTHKTTDSAKKSLRAMLLTALTETGAPALRLTHHTISTSNGQRSIAVTDLAAIPDEFMVQPPKVPDMDAIKARWKANNPVPGTDRRNGSPYLTVSARSE